MAKVKIEPKAFWEDLKWGEKNYPKLQTKYPDRWVAIANKKIVSAGKSLKNVELEAEIKTKRRREKIPVLFVEGKVKILPDYGYIVNK